ncbi:MAG TPA: tetratricopeptide repeat protein [Stellaceae bacterium]|nr:tetratricopeptide repeat protein [Stellaceae bacterium]
MPIDPRGLELTARDPASVERLEAVLAAYCAFKKDTGDRLKAALAGDPQLVLAHLMRGYFMLLLSKRELLPRALQAVQAADTAMAQASATPRERLHRRALAAWIERDEITAAQILASILIEWPTDILALKLVQYLLFYAGDAAAMRDATERALACWDAAAPLYGYALGCHAFGLEECGEYEAAESLGRRAVSLNPDDIWATHAVAHVFEMQDRCLEGERWIGANASVWGDANNFAYHVAWHRCLFLFALGRHDEILARYDAEVRAEPSDDYLDVSNAVSLLWRLEQAGVDVGPRWLELGERARARRDDHMLAFADVHYAMALAASRDDEAGAAWLASSRAYAGAMRETQAAVMAEIGIVLGEAAEAHRRGAYARAVDLLLPRRDAVRRIGGSHAQRDLFAQLLIDSAIKSGRHAVARMLLAERLAQRPHNSWAAAALALIGD